MQHIFLMLGTRRAVLPGKPRGERGRLRLGSLAFVLNHLAARDAPSFVFLAFQRVDG